MLKYFLALMLFANLSLFAAETSIGETLEKKMWEYTKDNKWDEIEKRIAPYYQSVAFLTGAQNKNQFMIHLKALNVSDYKFSNFSVTNGPDLMVVTYDVSVSETLEGKRISSNASRLSVWQKVKDEWLWVAHVILVPVPEGE